jgi:hypothetical protein
VTPADEADIAVQVDLTDVRLAATGADYAFTLELVMLGSITERDVPGRAVTTTVTSLSAGSFLWPLRVIVPCQADPDPDVGAHCHVSTTLDAVTPGAVVEGRRAVWEPDRVLVNDGGDDADASTPFNNEPLATQGLFIP